MERVAGGETTGQLFSGSVGPVQLRIRLAERSLLQGNLHQRYAHVLRNIICCSCDTTTFPRYGKISRAGERCSHRCKRSKGTGGQSRVREDVVVCAGALDWHSLCWRPMERTLHHLALSINCSRAQHIFVSSLLHQPK